MSLGLFSLESKQTFHRDVKKCCAKTHATYWIPTLLPSLHSFKCPPWHTSDIHSNYLVNGDLRLNKKLLCGEVDWMSELASHARPYEWASFSLMEILQDDVGDCVFAPVTALILTQFVCIDWNLISRPCFPRKGILSFSVQSHSVPIIVGIPLRSGLDESTASSRKNKKNRKTF